MIIKLTEYVCKDGYVLLNKMVNNDEIYSDVLFDHFKECDHCKKSFDKMLKNIKLPPTIKLLLPILMPKM